MGFFPTDFGKTWNQSLSLCPMIFFCWIFFRSFGTSKKSPWGFTNCLPKNDRRGAIFSPSFFHFQDFGVTVAGHCAQCGLGCATCRTAGSCMECAMARFFLLGGNILIHGLQILVSCGWFCVCVCVLCFVK